MDFSGIITTLLSIPTEIYVLVLGASGVSVVTQVVKKLSKAESAKVITFIFTSISFITAGFDYLMQSGAVPPTILGFNTLAIMGMATLIYRYAVKPLSLFASAVMAYQTQIQEKANDITGVTAQDIANVAPETPVVPIVEDTTTQEILEDKIEQKRNIADF